MNDPIERKIIIAFATGLLAFILISSWFLV